MTILRFIVMALATRRLTSLVVDDEITKDIRLEIWKRFPPETSKIGYLISCRKCSSIWAGLVITILACVSKSETHTRSLANLLLDTLALSEISIIADEFAKVSNNSMFD